MDAKLIELRNLIETIYARLKLPEKQLIIIEGCDDSLEVSVFGYDFSIVYNEEKKEYGLGKIVSYPGTYMEPPFVDIADVLTSTSSSEIVYKIANIVVEEIVGHELENIGIDEWIEETKDVF